MRLVKLEQIIYVWRTDNRVCVNILPNEVNYHKILHRRKIRRPEEYARVGGLPAGSAYVRTRQSGDHLQPSFH